MITPIVKTKENIVKKLLDQERKTKEKRVKESWWCNIKLKNLKVINHYLKIMKINFKK